MAWNSGTNKSLNDSLQKKSLGYGIPISNNPSFSGQAYKDGWDIERAYKEGMQKITWVNRCIEAISGNQARLPIILRKDNSSRGEVLGGKTAKRSTLLELLNNKPNIGENSYIFRYRLSAQLLLGTRGVFIEKIRGRDGGIIALNLLPPQSTAPIPDVKKFVSGYEVMMPTGDKVYLKPEDVCWIRRPHPIDPYLSLTPLEASGVAIEIENLAKIYNRNYLLNDGRPGGLLVVRGEIDEDDKDELRARFRGNLAKTGQTTVIAADDGVDFIDTSASPRDAAYIQMREVTKQEILAAFGVPESVIGNAAGRTFSNAAEEIRVFWMETMLPHLEPIARALDELDDENYVDFDTSGIPILMLYKQERDRYLLSELQAGLISPNEYRLGSSRKEVEADLADSLLMNPNLIPIANTKKKMEENAATIPGQPPGMPGMPGMPGGEGMPPQMPGMPPQPSLDPNTMQGAMAEVQQAPQQGQPGGDLAQSTIPAEAGNITALTLNQNNEIQTKSVNKLDEINERSEVAIERWSEILGRGIERVLERQQRVVLEKVTSLKSRRALMAGKLDVDSIIFTDTWDRQIDDDLKPVVSSIIKDASEIRQEKNDALGLKSKSIPAFDFVNSVESQLTQIKKINTQLSTEIKNLISKSFDLPEEERRVALIRDGIVGAYTEFFGHEQDSMVDAVVKSSWSFGQSR